MRPRLAGSRGARGTAVLRENRCEVTGWGLQRSGQHPFDLVLGFVVAVGTPFRIFTRQGFELFEIPSDHALLHLEPSDPFSQVGEDFVAAQMGQQFIPIAFGNDRDSPGMRKCPHAEIVHPYFAVDVIDIVVV